MEGGPNKTKLDVMFEKITPIVSLVLILFPIVISFISIDIAIIYLGFVYVYLFYKAFVGAIEFSIGFRRLKSAEIIDWKRLSDGLENPDKELAKLNNVINDVKEYKWKDFRKNSDSLYEKLANSNPILSSTRKLPDFLEYVLFVIEKRKTIKFIKSEIYQLENFKKNGWVKPSELNHVIMIPHYKEPISLLRESIQRIADQTIDTKQITLVLGAEGRDPDGVAVSEQLREEFRDKFKNIWINNHILKEFELIGKSSNMNSAGRMAFKKMQELGWDKEKTIITSCDSDSKFSPHHFAYLSYLYCITKDSKYKFYNGAMIFYNNIWRLPFYARVKNSFHSTYNTSKLVRADKLIPFSTYSTSLWQMEKIDFWDPWVTPEDYHIYFKSIFTHPKKVSAVPMFIKIYSDAAEGKDHWETVKNNYFQSRRWAWGMSDDGWMIKNFIKNFFKMSWSSRYKTAHVLFDHTIGTSMAFLVIFSTTVPNLINSEFSNRASGVLFPILIEDVFRLTIIFLLVIIVLDYFMRPRPDQGKWWHNITRHLEWFVQPFASFFLSTLPGFEAQTRLMFGKYLDYYPTLKKGVEGEGAEEGNKDLNKE